MRGDFHAHNVDMGIAFSRPETDEDREANQGVVLNMRSWEAETQGKMRSSEALVAALGLRSQPRLVSKVRRMSLPRGMTFLLEVAVGDVDALRKAAALTDHPEAILQEAAGFFVEQILLSRNADNYRTLGASRDASYSELRRHMALLVRWLHPDLISGGTSRPCLDRSVYANLVTKAWDAVKTGARCKAKDTLTQGARAQNISKHPVIAILLRIDELQDEVRKDGFLRPSGSSGLSAESCEPTGTFSLWPQAA